MQLESQNQLINGTNLVKLFFNQMIIFKAKYEMQKMGRDDVVDTASQLFSRKLSDIGLAPKAAFLSALVAGILAHAYILTSSLVYHDSAYTMMQSVGATLSSGRWGLELLATATDALGATSQTFFLNGILSIFLIGLFCAIVVSLLGIRSSILAGVVGAIFAVFPSVAATFTYIFTAVYYFFAYFLAALSLWLYRDKPGVRTFVAGLLLLVFSISVYQASLCISVALVFSVAVIDVLYGRTDYRESIKASVALVALPVAAAAVYLILNKALVVALGISVTGYQGMSSVAQTDFALLLGALEECYTNFLSWGWNGFNFSLPIQLVLIGLTVISFASLCRDVFLTHKGPVSAVALVALTALTPVAMSCAYIMSVSAEYAVHSLMVYSLAVFIAFLAAILDHSQTFKAVVIHGKRLGSVVAVSVLLGYVFVAAQYWYLDSAAYFRMTFVQEEAQSWFTTLVTEIKSCDGYSDEVPVVFVGDPGKEDTTIFSYPQGRVSILGGNYSTQTLISDYSWLNFMKIHTGYNPKTVDDEEPWLNSEEVRSMPCYPDSGSIAIVNNAVVVKFSNNE